MVEFNSPGASVEALQRRVSLSIALEEAMIDGLSQWLSYVGDHVPENEVGQVERFIRTHRVGIIKHRALIGAQGIDV